jgi:hypothetical protein
MFGFVHYSHPPVGRDAMWYVKQQAAHGILLAQHCIMELTKGDLQFCGSRANRTPPSSVGVTSLIFTRNRSVDIYSVVNTTM